MTFARSTTGDEIAAAFPERVKGKTVLITGPSLTGIGAETVFTFVRGGASTVILVGRNPSKLQPVADKIREIDGSVAVVLAEADLSSLASVRSAAKTVLADSRVTSIDYIINNAGLMACPFKLTEDGIESQFAVNHVAHFLLTNLLRPKWAPDVTVVNVSSNGYRFSDGSFDDYNFERTEYFELFAYGNGKLGSALFTHELARRGVRSLTLHPGYIVSSLQQFITPELMGKAVAFLAKHPEYGGFTREEPKSYAQGCSTTLRAALDPSLPNGSYLEDCQVAPLKVENIDEKAQKLWRLTETLVGETFE